MKSKFLFPTWCSIVGYILAIPGFVLGYLNVIKDYEIPGFELKIREKSNFIQPAVENFTNELAVFLVVLGLILIAFSKKKREDELSANVRLSSLYWGVMIYYILLFSNVLWGNFVGDIPFVGEHTFDLTVFMMMVIFIARFSYLSLISKEKYIVRKPRFLPYRPFRMLGMVISIVSLAVLVYATFIAPNLDSDLDGYAYASSLLGLVIWAFSKYQTEDEMTMQLRLESLQLAVYFNYLFLLLATLLLYSLAYLYALVLSTLSLLIFFIIRMEYVNFKNNQLLKNLEGDLHHEK